MTHHEASGPQGNAKSAPRAHIDGKSSSPKTISSSSLSSSGNSPFFLKKLLASKIMGSLIFKGKMPLSEFVLTIPELTSEPLLLTSPLWLPSTTLNHSSHERV